MILLSRTLISQTSCFLKPNFGSIDQVSLFISNFSSNLQHCSFTRPNIFPFLKNFNKTKFKLIWNVFFQMFFKLIIWWLFVAENSNVIENLAKHQFGLRFYQNEFFLLWHQKDFWKSKLLIKNVKRWKVSKMIWTAEVVSEKYGVPKYKIPKWLRK